VSINGSVSTQRPAKYLQPRLSLTPGFMFWCVQAQSEALAYIKDWTADEREYLRVEVSSGISSISIVNEKIIVSCMHAVCGISLFWLPKFGIVMRWHGRYTKQQTFKLVRTCGCSLAFALHGRSLPYGFSLAFAIHCRSSHLWPSLHCMFMVKLTSVLLIALHFHGKAAHVNAPDCIAFSWQTSSRQCS
jgi:hypothetical protein